MSRQHLSWRQLSISAISQLVLTGFGPNFKGRFSGNFLTDANCHGVICPVNICPGDICPYQLLLTRFWPNFKGSKFLDKSFLDLQFFLSKICWDPHIFFRHNIFLDTIILGGQKCLSAKFLGAQFFIGHKLSLDQKFLWTTTFFSPKNFVGKKFFRTKIFFNEWKLVLGPAHVKVKVKVQIKKLRNIGVLPWLFDDLE